jgi:hypothetical protein
LNLDPLSEAQDRLAFGLLPGWGACIQPIAFALCLLSLAGWRRSQPEGADDRLGDGLLMATVVAVFLGGWHVPWVSDSAFARALDFRVWLLIPAQLSVFALKLGVMEAAVRKAAAMPRWFPPSVDGFALSIAAAVNLVLTWAILSGRGM